MSLCHVTPPQPSRLFQSVLRSERSKSPSPFSTRLQAPTLVKKSRFPSNASAMGRDDLVGIPNHNQENAQTHIIMHTTVGWERESRIPYTLPVSSGRGLRRPRYRPRPPTCVVPGSAGGAPGRPQSASPGHRRGRETARPHAGPRDHRSLERRRQRDPPDRERRRLLRAPIQSRGVRPHGAPRWRRSR